MIKKHLFSLLVCSYLVGSLGVTSFATTNDIYSLKDSNGQVIQTFDSLEKAEQYIQETYNTYSQNAASRWTPCAPGAGGPHSITTKVETILLWNEDLGRINGEIVIFECKWCGATRTETRYF